MAQPNLDNPEYAAFAWRRFRTIMLWMTLASAVTAGLGLWFLDATVGPLTLHMAIAAALGVFFTVLLAAFLMGLVFLSAGSGHDDTIQDIHEDFDR